MNTYEVETLLKRLGLPYYCAVWRVAWMTGIPAWKIRHAMDSGSLRRSGDGTIARVDLAEWIKAQPMSLKRLVNAVTKIANWPELQQEADSTAESDIDAGSDGNRAVMTSDVPQFGLTAEAVDAAITITITVNR